MAAQPVRNWESSPAQTVEPRLMDRTDLRTERVSRQAYGILKFGFVLAPIVAGADKFFNVLTDWTRYLATVVPNTLGVSAQNFMYGVGVIEIIAGIGVALKPKVFGYVVSAWMFGIVINLLMTGEYYDIALRDVGLGLGAFALARLASAFDRRDRSLP